MRINKCECLADAQCGSQKCKAWHASALARSIQARDMVDQMPCIHLGSYVGPVPSG